MNVKGIKEGKGKKGWKEAAHTEDHGLRSMAIAFRRWRGPWEAVDGETRWRASKSASSQRSIQFEEKGVVTEVWVSRTNLELELRFLLKNFLVACYATLHPAMSVSWSVSLLVGRSVGPIFTFSAFWAFWACGSCPDALVTFSSTAPAYPHATRVAVYPALFLVDYLQCFLNVQKCFSDIYYPF